MLLPGPSQPQSNRTGKNPHCPPPDESGTFRSLRAAPTEHTSLSNGVFIIGADLRAGCVHKPNSSKQLTNRQVARQQHGRAASTPATRTGIPNRVFYRTFWSVPSTGTSAAVRPTAPAFPARPGPEPRPPGTRTSHAADGSSSSNSRRATSHTCSASSGSTSPATAAAAADGFLSTICAGSPDHKGPGCGARRGQHRRRDPGPVLLVGITRL